MATIHISLSEELTAFVESQTVREGHASAAEYVRFLIRQAQKCRATQELEAKLLEGMQGPAVEMTREDWESIRREAMEGLSDGPTRP